MRVVQNLAEELCALRRTGDIGDSLANEGLVHPALIGRCIGDGVGDLRLDDGLHRL